MIHYISSPAWSKPHDIQAYNSCLLCPRNAQVTDIHKGTDRRTPSPYIPRMTDDATLPPAPPFDAVLEAAVYAPDLDAAEEFYAGVLGLEKIARVDDRHVFFRAGKTVVLVFNPTRTREASTNPDMPVPPHGAEGPGHLCLAADAAAIAEWADRLKAAGVPIEADFHWPNGARSIYFRDPADNSLEIAEPRLWFPEA